MVMSKIKRKIADRFLHVTIYYHINNTYFKKGITPTVEQVIQDIDKDALNTLLSQGYTEDEINKIVEDTIRRKKCKG